MGRILLRAYFLRRNLFCAGTALGFLAIGSMRGWSAPEWWSGTPGDAVKAAIQGKKNLIFYFRTELGEDCIEMEKQTWPKISADDFKNKFIWVKVDPGEESGRNVFEYFDVFQTPEIVIARPGTNQPEEVDRINGFVSSDTLKQRIAGVKFDAPAKPPAAAGPKGKAPPEPETSAVTLFTADFGEKGKPIALDGKIFDPYLNLVGGVKVDPKEGIGETPALSV
ncbi:thioredoxin family protein, partial [Candidatus Sumerlaeota bacterium]|nr:thioredoxin family protein [Candidatus Sumerlaeota bacterium]